MATSETTHPNRWRWLTLTVVLIVTGVAGAVFCHRWHFCDCGHLAHDSFSTQPLHHWLDSAWGLASVGALTLALKLQFDFLRWPAAGLVILAAYRFMFETVEVRESWLGWLPYPV